MAINRPGPVSLRERMFFDRSKPVRSFIARWAVRLGIPVAAGLIAHAAIVPDLEHIAPFISNIDAQTMAQIIIGVSTAALAAIKIALVGRVPKQLSAPNIPVAVAKPFGAVPPPAAVAAPPAAVVSPPAAVVPPPAAVRAPVAPPPPPRRPIAPPPPPPPVAKAVAAPVPMPASVRELFEQGEFTLALRGADMNISDDKRIMDEIVERRAIFGKVLQQIEALKKAEQFTLAADRLEAILKAGLLVSKTEVDKLKDEVARLRGNPREGTVDLTIDIDINEIGLIGTPDEVANTMLSLVPPQLAPAAPVPAPAPAPTPAPVPAMRPLPSAPTAVPPAPAPAPSNSSATSVGGQMDLFIQALKNDTIRQQLVAAGNNKRALKIIMESISGEDIAGIESQFDAAYELVARG